MKCGYSGLGLRGKGWGLCFVRVAGEGVFAFGEFVGKGWLIGFFLSDGKLLSEEFLFFLLEAFEASSVARCDVLLNVSSLYWAEILGLISCAPHVLLMFLICHARGYLMELVCCVRWLVLSFNSNPTALFEFSLGGLLISMLVLLKMIMLYANCLRRVEWVLQQMLFDISLYEGKCIFDRLAAVEDAHFMLPYCRQNLAEGLLVIKSCVD